jgi:hypothetical protein
MTNMAGTSLDLACNYTDTGYSQPNQTSCTPDFVYLLVSSTSFSSSSPISLFLFQHPIIIAVHKVKLSLSMSPCHDHELTPRMAYTKYNIHRLWHTASTTYPEYSILRVHHTPKYNIHRVQDTPSVVYTEYIIHRSTASNEYSIHHVHHTPKYSIHP